MRRVQVVIKKEREDSHHPLPGNTRCSHCHAATWRGPGRRDGGCQSLWVHPPHFRVRVCTFSSLHTWTATVYTVL